MTTKLTKIRDHTLNESSHSNVREYEDASLQDLLRHHEDSGIDMSPMKKDDNLEGEDFLERARKVSLGSRYHNRQRKLIVCIIVISILNARLNCFVVNFTRLTVMSLVN